MGPISKFLVFLRGIKNELISKKEQGIQKLNRTNLSEIFEKFKDFSVGKAIDSFLDSIFPQKVEETRFTSFDESISDEASTMDKGRSLTKIGIAGQAAKSNIQMQQVAYSNVE